MIALPRRYAFGSNREVEFYVKGASLYIQNAYDKTRDVQVDQEWDWVAGRTEKWLPDSLAFALITMVDMAIGDLNREGKLLMPDDRVEITLEGYEVNPLDRTRIAKPPSQDVNSTQYRSSCKLAS
jgi:hypothetical protein